MKRSAGVFALLAVLVAGARLTNQSPGITGGDRAGSLVEHVSSSLQVADTGCREFSETRDANGTSSQGEIAALVGRYLHGNPEAQSQSGSLSGRLPVGMKFIVATVADPLHTHLNLQFDRTIEAFQQAAQDQKYTYDSSWLPWKQSAAEYSSRDDEKKEEEDTTLRERCPGLVLFRGSIQQPATQLYNASYSQGLFLFLVAEKPTTGINRTQWNNALEWIDQHADPGASEKALRVLGPTFSGSVPSMVRAVIDLSQQNPRKFFTNVLLYTGTMRGCAAYAWMNEQLSKSGALPLRTADFDENDAIQIDRYFRYLADRGHSLSEIAILSEDETAYGGLPDNHPQPESEPHDAPAEEHSQPKTPPPPTCTPTYDKDNRPLHLYYPRDISALRSAYQEQSIFASTDSQNTAHLVLQPQVGRSTHQDTDTVATFSGANSALAQEAQMYGVVDSLRTHGIRFVIVRSTSSLDQLFLTRFLHRAYADAFVVTLGSDMLFGREIDSTEFRGVVALTAFPLLPRGQDLTAVTENARRHAHRVFGSNSMEGSYLAARFLIADPDTVAKEPQPYLHPYPSQTGLTDYASPLWASGPNRSSDPLRPSTWLSVVGRDGYWPLAVLTEPYKEPSLETPALRSNLALVQAPRHNSATDVPLSMRRLSLSPVWKLCCELALLGILLHFFACRYGWNHQNLSMFIQFSPAPGGRHLAVVCLGWGIIVTTLVLMFLCSSRIDPYLHFADSIWTWGLGIGAVLGCLGNAADLRRRFSAEPRSIRKRTRFTITWIIFPLLLLAIALWVGVSTFYGSDANAVPTAYRAVHLTSGVSPMVSLLILLAGFYWWFWLTLSGLALLGQGRPVLPRRAGLPVALIRISDEMARDIEGFAMPLPSSRIGKGIFYLFPLALLVLQFCILCRASTDGLDLMLHSLESSPFDRTLQATVAIAFCLLVLECAQLVSTWLSLKRLLLALNRTPLRRTFYALKGLSMFSLWSMSGTSSRSRYTIFSHQLESLHHLRTLLHSFDARDSGDEKIRAVTEDTFKQGRAFIETLCRRADLAMINNPAGRRIRKIFRRCAEQSFNELILRQWSYETKSLDLAENGGEPGSSEVLPLSDNELTRHAEEFVCLTYVGYLQNLLGCMRTMALSILGLFAAIAFSLAFYPYTPRPAIVLSLLFLLLVVGSIVAWVYAGLSRDATISHITNTQPGVLGTEFWIRLASFIGVPFVGLLAAQFPGITDFLVSWIEPGLNAVKQ